MTPEQALNELRKELAINDRIAKLLISVGEAQEVEHLRSAYTVNSHDAMVVAIASGNAVSKFIKHITAGTRQPEKPARSALG